MLKSPVQDDNDYLVKHQFPGWSLEMELQLQLPELDANYQLLEDSDESLHRLILGFGVTGKNLTGDEDAGTPSIAEFRQSVNEVIAYRISLESADPDLVARMARERRQETRARRFEELKAKDHLQFFSDPAASADLEEWKSLPIWTQDEAIALSLGKNPRIVSYRSLGPRVGSPFVKEYRRRKDVISRAILAKQLEEPLLPDKFILWCKKQTNFGWAGPSVNERSLPTPKEIHGGRKTVCVNYCWGWRWASTTSS